MKSKHDLLTAPPWITAPPSIAGILNVTPDSFSDGGKFAEPSLAITQAKLLAEQGAAIIDIGGESTRPGSLPIPSEVEIQRILPVVQALAAELFISVDTYQAKTAAAVLSAGARMINDISALRADQEMRAVVREHHCYVVLMYSKESAAHPHASETKKDYEDVMQEISQFLHRQVNFALDGGIAENRIIIDPGMGKFLSHAPKYSWEVLKCLPMLREHGLHFPILVSTSRKGFLGGELKDRDPISQLTALIATLKGTALIRTHNVSMAHEYLRVWRTCGE